MAGTDLNAGGGETDLRRLLAGLAPALDARRFTFGLASGFTIDSDAFAVVREEEATTVVRADPEGQWARVTLTVHSSLDSVGLTAAVASALAERGISANVIAAAFHDHLFVPWDRREDALEALKSLSREGR
jgi:hypothetical protein